MRIELRQVLPGTVLVSMRAPAEAGNQGAPMSYDGKISPAAAQTSRATNEGARMGMGVGKQTLTMALPPIQRAADIHEGTAPTPPAASSEGKPMAPQVRAKMEAAFGADFSAVRIHEGGQAAAVGARAYTQGSDIHFAPGQYQPETQAGQELLGHELTHVVQQAQGRVGPAPQAKGGAINDDPSLEHEADQLGAKAARGEQVHGGAGIVAGNAGAGVMQPKWEKVDDQRYDQWDAPINEKRWFRKLTPMGFQFASEALNVKSKLKIFLTARTIGNALPPVLVPEPTGVVFGTQDRDAAAVKEAFHIGYREFDTAESYQNIKQVAEGLASNKRAELRIIYKFDMRDPEELDVHVRTVAALFGGYLDVAMIHNLPDSSQQLAAAVKRLNHLKETGVIHKVGLSGVEKAQATPETLGGIDVVENDVTKPDNDRDVRDVCHKLGIEYLGHGVSHLVNPTVDEIAKTYKVSSTALILAWAKAHGVKPLMSSGKTERRIENADASHDAVPREAVEALTKRMATSSKKKAAASIDDLPPAPPECAGRINELLQMTYLDNDGWTIAKAKFTEMKKLMQFIKPIGAYACLPVPAVKEVPDTYHGKAVGAVVKMIPATNHCDRQKLFQAFVAGLRNIYATPLEEF
jgi:diketogulonate reductase-like aldo/keto reductase